MAITENYELLYNIAKMYYYDKMNQVEIANKTSLSRPTISRMLDAARSCGMVHVTLRMPTDAIRNQELSEQIREAFGIKRVIIVPVNYEDTTPESLDALSHEVTIAAAEYMPELLSDSEYIGIGWGRSMYNTSLHLRHIRDGKNRFFVQMINNFPAGSSFLQPSVIVGRFAEAFFANGYSYFFNGIHGSPEEDANLALLKDYWKKLDTAIISMTHSGHLLSGYSYGYASDLWRANPTNPDPSLASSSFECLGQICSANGSKLAVNKTFNMIAYDIEHMKDIPNVICIAAGKKKTDAVIQAGKLHFFNTLIVDSITAETIIDKLSEQ